MRRSTRARKSTVAVSDLEEATPSQKESPAEEDSPDLMKPFAFSSRASVLSFSKGTSSSNKRKKPVSRISSLLPSPVPAPPPPAAQRNLTSISDLKKQASSSLEDLKRHLDRSHSEILKDVEASRSRLQKRFKIQSQASQQMMDEAEKEHKKMSEQIKESFEAMKDSYSEFIAEAQTTASRVCKTSMSELSQSLEKKIDGLRSRFGISAANKQPKDKAV